MKKILFNISLILIVCSVTSCNEAIEPAFNGFNKIYPADEFVESIDIVFKSDQSGFLILTNVKNNANTNSNICLLDIDTEGNLVNKIPILTPTYDEATAISAYNNELYISGTRRNDESSLNYSSFLIKCDQNGIPVNENGIEDQDTIGFSAVFKSFGGYNSLKINDLLIADNKIITTGGIDYISGFESINEIFLIHDLSSINFNNESDLPQPEVVFTSDLDAFDEGKFIFPDNSFNFGIIMENTLPNDDSQISNPSRNIGLRLNSNYNQPTTEFNNIGDNNDVVLGAAVSGYFGDEIFIGGNYLAFDSLFISKVYRSTNSGQENYIERRFNFSGYGNSVTAIGQLSDGRLLVATAQFTENNDGSTYSNLLEFKPNPVLSDKEPIVLQNNNFQTIKKLLVGQDNEVYIVSDLEFGNEAHAISLTKVLF